MAGQQRKKNVATPAKISAPRMMEIHRRARLFRILDRARRKRIVFVVGPAGAGKTSLVASYLAARRLPALWYNVDARDADVANLFEYLSMATRASARGQKLALPTYTAENEAGAGAFARTFFEALCRRRPVPSVIVFDDYQDARSDRWNHVISEALRALPKGISAIIVSRAQPPPFLARYIGAGELTTVGWDELRLTPAEMKALVRVVRPDLRGAQLNAALPRILELAHGWAAALRLLLHNRAVSGLDASGIEQFSQPHFDYFASEILNEATDDQRRFLLRTSVTPTLTAKLAARLTNTPDAGLRLAELERRSFLIQRLGTSETYRYHPLLRGFLQQRAEADLGSAEVQELHRLAAESLVESGQIDEAMDEFETAKDVSMRKELLLRVAPVYMGGGRSHTLSTWIDRLPRETVDSDGWLLYWDALCHLGYAPSRSREQLEKAYAFFADQANAEGLYRTCAAAMQAIVHEGADFHRLDPWIERFESMKKQGPACPEHLLSLAATGMLMASLFHRADSKQNRYWAEQAMTLAAKSPDIGHRIMTGGLLAVYFAFYESTARAAVVLEMLRASARAASSSTLAVLTQLEGDALCAWVRGENAECLKLVREALAIASRTGVFVWNDYLNGLGASAALGSEDVDAAQEFLEPMAEAAQMRGAFAGGNYHFYASWEAFLRGATERAHHSIAIAGSAAESLGYTFAQSINAFAWAQIHWQLGRAREANETLARARESAERAGCTLILHSCDLVESEFAWEDDRDRALARLRSGLALARANGYLNGFWLRRPTMAKAAVRALEHGIETEHVRVYVTKHRLVPEHVPARVEAWPWRYRVRVLGSFELRQNADTSALEAELAAGGATLRGMPLRMLKAIVAHGARGVRDSQLVDVLWPDAEGDAARRVFDTTLHRLRRQLGDDQVVRLVDGLISLDGRLCWVDVWALDDLLVELEQETKAHARPTVLAHLATRLLGVYRGPLLRDEPHEGGWIHGPRDRIARKFARAAEPLGRALEKAGHVQEATNLYRRVLDGDPLAEACCAGVMRCAVATGRPAEAARTFEEYRARLAASLEAEPGPDISGLYDRLVRPPVRGPLRLS